MKSRNLFQMSAVMIMALVCVCGLQAQNSAAQAAAQQRARAAQRLGVRPGPEAQPYMQQALAQLRQAEATLERGAADKGGHRLKAIQRVKQAEIEVQAGIDYANKH